MKWVFWIAAALLLYTYAGYPCWLWLRAHWRRWPVKRSPILPSVSIVVAVRNEAAVLSAKLRNLACLDYPAERLEVIVVSDGSTDGTNKILESAGAQIRSVISVEHHGKAAALNQAVELARGEIVVFTDARQTLEPGSVRELVASFADENVGCVSGELMLSEPESAGAGKGLGLYWRLEKRIRQLEAATGSAAGATGALYAVRRNLLGLVPAGTLLDDVFIPMQVVRQGKRVVFEPGARAWDSVFAAQEHEFRRKVRTLLGNYQLITLAPWLVSPSNPLLFEFVSHKLLRLLSPFLLLVLLVSSSLLPGPFYRYVLLLQLAFYALAAVGAVRPRLHLVRRIASLAYTFLMLNAAAMLAFVYFVTRKRGVWAR